MSPERGARDDEFAISFLEQDGSVFVEARGDIDLDSVAAFGDGLREAVARSSGQVRVDLAGITFLGSEGIRTLVLAHDAAVADGRRITVTEASTIVRRVLALTESEWLLDA